MNSQNIDPKLWALLTTKEYVVLSSEDKLFVSALMTEAVYTQWRSTNALTAKAYAEEFEAFTFDEGKLKNRLDKHLQKQHAPVVALINRGVPVWQVAAMWVCILFGAGWYFVASKSAAQSLPMLAKVDTVFVPVASLPTHDTVYLKVKETTKYKSVTAEPVHIQSPEKIDVSNEEHLLKRDWEINISDYKNNDSPGQSMDEDTISGKFMIGVL